jgi:hypothetical protein
MDDDGGQQMKRTRWIAGGVVTLVLAVAPVSASAAGIGSVVDLGVNIAPLGPPMVVNAQDEVPVENGNAYGIWVNGTIETPAPPSSDASGKFIPQAINSAGVVVGYAATSLGAQVPAYWDSLHSPSFVEISLSALAVNGQAVSTGRLVAVDATGESVGGVGNARQTQSADSAGLFVPGTGGLPAGGPQVIANLGSASVRGLNNISAGWEAGSTTAGTLFAYNRASGATTTSNLTGTESGPGSLASNGLMAGTINGGTDQEVENPSGAITILQAPAGTGGGVYGITASGLAVGVVRNMATTGGTWSASGVWTPLLSELTANDPGFTSFSPLYVDDTGDIDGSGAIGAQSHGFLVRVKPIVPPVVTSTRDAAAADPSSGSCDTGQTVADATGAQVPECTLRAAIQAVNALGKSSQQITFNIPPVGLAPVALASPLPAIIAPGTTVDATTEAGGSIAVDGTKLAGKGSCLTAQTTGIIIGGFDLQNCPIGVELAAPGQDKVQGDVIGLGSDGVTKATGVTGVQADAGSTGNLIGGTDAPDRDVISAQGNGVVLNGSDNLVQGDFLGTDVTGRAFVPDQLGVVVNAGSSGDTIGGSTKTTGAPPGNVIVSGDPSSQFDYGVITLGGSLTAAGNLIGTDASGTIAYAPKSGHAARAGVLIAGPADGDVIGGRAGSGNVIAGASLAQVELDGAGAVKPRVVGNRIGVGTNGEVLVSPDAAGVLDAAAAEARIGDSGEANTITGQKDGVVISKDSQEIDFTVSKVVDGQTEFETYALPGTDTPAKVTGALVKDNVIGPLPGGESAPKTAQEVGVLDVGGKDDAIGPRNVISFNAVGVALEGTLDSGTEGNLIGTDAGGLEALPNGVGIRVEKGAEKTPIGVTGTPDTISGNKLGLDLDAGTTIVHGERVGPNSRGTALLKAFHGTLPTSIRDAVKSAEDGGILVDGAADSTIIGGTDRGEPVTVGGTDGTGITVRSHALLARDRIGVAVSSRTALPNKGDGLKIDTDGREPVLFAAGIIAHSDGIGALVAGHRNAMIVLTPIYDNAKGGLQIHSLDVPKAPKVVHAVNEKVHGDARTVITTELAVPHGDFGQVELYATPACERHGGGEKGIAVEQRLHAGSHKEIKIDADTEPVGTAITALLTVTPGNDLAAELDQRKKPDGSTSTFSECEEVKASK